jgi:hypothetical protein
VLQVANFDYINEEDALAAAAAAEEAEREERAKLEAEMNGQGKVQFWENLLKDRVVEQQLEELEELGKGKRSRKQVQKIVSTDFNPQGRSVTLVFITELAKLVNCKL